MRTEDGPDADPISGVDADATCVGDPTRAELGGVPAALPVVRIAVKACPGRVVRRFRSERDVCGDSMVLSACAAMNRRKTDDGVQTRRRGRNRRVAGEGACLGILQEQAVTLGTSGGGKAMAKVATTSATVPRLLMGGAPCKQGDLWEQDVSAIAEGSIDSAVESVGGERARRGEVDDAP